MVMTNSPPPCKLLTCERGPNRASVNSVNELNRKKLVSQERVQRRLAAILFADVVGYSRITAQDEVGTWRRLQSVRIASNCASASISVTSSPVTTMSMGTEST